MDFMAVIAYKDCGFVSVFTFPSQYPPNCMKILTRYFPVSFQKLNEFKIAKHL